MYLKSIEIKNFRKFYHSNKVEFVYNDKCNSDDYEIDISAITTLIVGKNNTGKTTIVEGLDKIINNNKFCSTDFNFNYLNECIDNGIDNNIPFIEFKITIDIDLNKDIFNNLLPIIDFGFIKQNIDNDKVEQTFFIRWQVKETEAFIDLYKKKTSKKDKNISVLLNVIEESEYELKYYKTEKDDKPIKDFKLNDLIELKPISANNLKTDNCLTKAFSKIILYKYNELKQNNEIQDKIDNANESITQLIEKNISSEVNKNLSVFGNKFQVALKSDVEFKDLISSLTKYEFKEAENNIPENQFGLGYTNLIMIIAKIIDYVEASEKSFDSNINLISIEEPEVYMHPQMQELLIKNIESMIQSIFENKNKKLNLQIIITTHLSHILNSKIHFGNSFNNINYITNTNNYIEVIKLSDEKIKSCIRNEKSKNKKEKTLNYIKKYVKYKFSELFFSDAVILVEGVTEEVLLNYYLSKDEKLMKYYISIFNVNGAYSHIYHSLLEILKVPALIITDLDIEREKEEIEIIKKDGTKKTKTVNSLKQIKDIIGKKTTNESLKYYVKNLFSIENDINNIFDENDKFKKSIEKPLIKDNIIFTCQNKVEGFYPSSLEEAIFLENYDKESLIEVFKVLFPDLYSSYLEDCKIKININKSYEIQYKINENKKKSEFANKLLMYMIDNEDNDFIIPKYIEEGLNELLNKLEGVQNE